MTTSPQDDLTTERAASGKSKRLAAHELLKEIVGIIPMQPEQRCRRIDLLLDYAKTARQEALREAEQAMFQLIDGRGLTAVQVLEAQTKIKFAFHRLASEGG